VAVITDNQTVSSNVSGFKKRIDESAATMMLDNLQTFMYQKPIQSCVRESVSNAIDSVKEKRMAIDILEGRAKVEDYYVEKEIDAAQADIYQDSKFNKEYYQLKWLDVEDKVTINYHNGEQNKRDVFTITDTGVGLGGSRLEGYFNLGYSSKRLNSNELGGFGLGAKSPLSTGVESYRVISRYNGMEFAFDVYSHKVDCVYGKWNDDGTANEYYEFEPQIVGYEDLIDEAGEPYQKPIYHRFKAYYRKTLKKNGCSIIVEVKKHNKNQYFEAVRSQLMYIREDVTFTQTYSDNKEVHGVPFKATIIYEDDHIILSDNNFYHAPHFVIKNIGYGLIQYGELEMTPRQGNIGIKLQMENIDVVPSREALAYTPKTREATIEEHGWVDKIVETKIQASLSQDSFLLWIRACNNVMLGQGSRGDDDRTLGILAKIADKSQLKPQYKKTGIRYNTDTTVFMTPLLSMQYVYQKQEYTSGKWVHKIKRDDSNNITSFNNTCYFQFTPSSSRTTQYLISKEQQFTVIRAAKAYSYLDPVLAKVDASCNVDELVKEAETLVRGGEADKLKRDSVMNWMPKTIAWLKAMASAPEIKVYSDSLVPADWVMKAEDEKIDTEVASEEQRKADYKAILAKRKANNIFIGSIPGAKYESSKSRSVQNGFTKKEIKFNDLDIDTCKVVYGTEEQNPVFQALTHTQRYKLTPRDQNEPKDFFWNDDVKLLRIAKSNIKYVQEDGVKLEDWVLNISEEGVLTTCEPLAACCNATMLNEKLTERSKFLTNFVEFDSTLSSKYHKLRILANTEVKLFDSDRGTKLNAYGSHALLTHLTDAYKANFRMLEQNATPEEREALVPAELKEKGVKDIQLIDEELYKEVKWIGEFVEVYGPMLGYIAPLGDPKRPVLQPDVASEIKEYIRSKRDQLEGEYPDLIK
jgi:hypothetical protein